MRIEKLNRITINDFNLTLSESNVKMEKTVFEQLSSLIFSKSNIFLHGAITY